MDTLGTTRQITDTDRADLIQFTGLEPDFPETMKSDVAAGKWKLDAGINVAIGGNVAARVPRAARQGFEVVIILLRRSSAEFLYIPD
jgi:hypothetical protein